MPGALEYEEEDLFGESDEEDIPLRRVNAAAPIAGPSYLRQPPPPRPSQNDRQSPPPVRQRPPPAPCPPDRVPLLKPSVALTRTRPRLLELKEMREVKPPPMPTVGPMSLKAQCMAVVKANTSRIWEIGDVQYYLIKDFIDDLPAEQLAAIEEACPHIREDTDWLWEYFLLTDFAAAHEKYAVKNGETRTSGWRRTYKRAAVEARERQQNAAERVAERYKEMDKERADKRIVVLDRVVQPGKTKRIPGGMFGAQQPMKVAAKATGPLGKARADAQRARIAMTHAAGKFIPLPSRNAIAGPSSISSIPIRGRPAPASIDGPRIPGPRPRAPPPPPPQSIEGGEDVIPGALPIIDYIAQRAKLPPHLAALPPSPSPISQPARFSVEKKRKFSTIRQPEVPNFMPPDPKSPGAGVRADFFGASPGTAGPRVKRRRSGGEGDVGSSVKIGRTTGEGRDRPSLSSPAGSPSRTPPAASRSTGSISADASTKLKSILFRSKPKVKVGSR